jgi:tRNA U34 5-carboxymethylaminomethyl modifying enzyme MnmG/GidA
LASHQPQQTTNELKIEHNAVNEKFLAEMLNPENARLHIFDDHGTLAIIDTRSQIAWLEPTRLNTQTNHSFNYEFATTSDFTKVSRKVEYDLQDWLWNLFWHSSEFQSYRLKKMNITKLSIGLNHIKAQIEKLHFYFQHVLYKELNFHKLQRNSNSLFKRFNNLFPPALFQIMAVLSQQQKVII